MVLRSGMSCSEGLGKRGEYRGRKKLEGISRVDFFLEGESGTKHFKIGMLQDGGK